MSDRPEHNSTPQASFLARWSQRKQEQHNKPETQAVEPKPTAPATVTEVVITREQDLPTLESLTEDSEVGMFLNEGISEAIQRKVLRKLFHMGKFNVCDGLDDYAEDYTFFEPLEQVLHAKEQIRQVTDKVRQTVAEETDSPMVSITEGDETTASAEGSSEILDELSRREENNEG